jgi:hypothetical protein
MKQTLMLLALFAVPAFAGEGKGTPQTHQCMKDGAVVQLTKKQCKKDGGTWEKIAGATPPPAPQPPPAPAN